jgi:DNA-binding NarL/FixJ family response regulator
LITEGVSKEIAAELARAIDGISFSDLQRVVMSAKKREILDGVDFSAELVRLSTHHNTQDKENSSQVLRNLQIVRMAEEGVSQRKIADAFGISHPTVGRIIKDHKGG